MNTAQCEWSALPLIEIVPDYIEWKRVEVKQTSIRSYAGVVNRYIIPLFGSDTYDTLNSRKVEVTLLSLLGQGRKLTTVKLVATVLKNLLTYVSEYYSLPRKQLKIRFPKQYDKRQELACYDDEEMTAIADYCRHADCVDGRRIGLLLALTSGMRIGEIAALKFGDIDLRRRAVNVDKTLSRVDTSGGYYKTSLQETSPKTPESNRRIPLHLYVEELLEGLTVNPAAYLLTLSTTPMDARSFARWYKRVLARELRFPKSRCLKFHALRHSFASCLLRRNADIKTTSAILGHASIKTTLDIYAHSSFDQKAKAVKNLFTIANNVSDNI